MRRANRRFAVERLEERYALAGNVLATVDGSGNLLITGDALANGVTIQGLGNPGTFGIFGFDAADVAAPGADQTLINGIPNGAVFVSGVTGTITVNLGAEDDTLLFWHFNHNGAMTVNAGAGNDAVYVGLANDPMFIVGYFTVNLGSGTDTLNEQFINIVGNHLITGDTVLDNNLAESNNWHSYTLTNSTFSGNVEMKMGYRAGSVEMNHVVTASQLTIENTSPVSTNTGIGKSRTASYYGQYDIHNTAATLSISLTSDVMSVATITACQTGGGLGIALYGYYNRALVQDSYMYGFGGSSRYTTVGAPQLAVTSYSPIDDYSLQNTVVLQSANFDVSGSARFLQSSSLHVSMIGREQIISDSYISGMVELNTDYVGDADITVEFSTILDTLYVKGRIQQRYIYAELLFGASTVNFVLLGSTVNTLSYQYNETARRWPGLDQAVIQYSVLNEMRVSFGNNNDQLWIVGSRVDTTTTLDGGSGTNTLTLSGNQSLNGFTKVNF